MYLCAVYNISVCRVCVWFVCPFVWGLAAPSLTTFLCFPPSRLRAALFPTVFHRIFANGESSLLPHLGLCLCSLCSPLRLPSACSRGSEPCYPTSPAYLSLLGFSLTAPPACPSITCLFPVDSAWLAIYVLDSYFPSSSGWFLKSYCAPRLSVICSHCL